MHDDIPTEEIEKILKEFITDQDEARKKVSQEVADRIRKRLLEVGLDRAAEIHRITLNDEDRKRFLNQLDPRLFPLAAKSTSGTDPHEVPKVKPEDARRAKERYLGRKLTDEEWEQEKRRIVWVVEPET